MRKKQVLSVMLPPEVRAWVADEAGRRRTTMSDLVVSLMTQGIATDSIERSISRVQAVVERAGISREGLRQTLATRYLVEKLARGEIRTTATVGYDADQWADKQLAKLWPNDEGVPT